MHVTDKEQFPVSNHFAVIEFSNSRVLDDPGDPRGSSESIVNETKYHVFPSEEKLTGYLSGKSPGNYVVILAKPVKVDKKIELTYKL